MRIRSTMIAGVLGLVHALPAAGQARHGEWIATRYEVALFESAAQPWHLASIEVGARRSRLTPVGRVNFASRFEQEGVQVELDLYPAWPGVGYAYVSGAWSKDGPFPELRGALELFAALPGAFEASAGAIHMSFEPGDDATILVGSLSKYAGNYWMSARPSWAIDTEDVALTLAGRRYLRTPGEFVTLRLMAGSTPEEIGLRGGTSLETLGVQADGQLEVSPQWVVLPLVGVTREERAAGDARTRYSLGIGTMYRF